MDPTLSIGVQTTHVRDIKASLKQRQQIEADFLLVPLFHPRLRRDSRQISCLRNAPSTRSDRELQCQEWANNVIGHVSDWIDLDNEDLSIRRDSFTGLKQELMWASHLCLQAVLLPVPRLISPNFARAVSQLLSLNCHQQMWVRIPLVSGLTYHHTDDTGIDNNISSTNSFAKDGWKNWDSFRHFCGHTHRLCVALELTEDIAEEVWSSAEMAMRRWAAEPVRALLLSTSMFVTNKAGYPVLSRPVQRVLEFFFEFRACRVVLTGRPRHGCAGSSSSSDMTSGTSSAATFSSDGPLYLPYIQYLRHLKSRHASNAAHSNRSQDRFTAAYRDTLQAPLQPLMDNLESQTYETFERDPVKYERYEAAVALALGDLRAKQLATCDTIRDGNDSAHSNADTIVITVVGAGRGPLVAAALSAAYTVDVPVRIYAVEKNCNAVITLRNRVLTERWSNVEVVEKDMRDWSPPELCDLMISELLGSFGDNELSPECLDGAQKCLKAGGVSIPADSTSYLAPMSSAKLWKCASEMLEGRGLDTPFVVLLHSHFLFADAMPLFRFEHPSGGVDAVDNTRYSSTGC